MTVNNDRIILNEIISKHHQDRASHMSEDEYFEIFVAEQILKDRDLTYDELFEGNPGGALDGGIDGIHLFVNGVWVDDANIEGFLKLKENVKIDFYIIQAKNKNNLEETVLDKFSAMVDDLFDLSNSLNDFEGIYNPDVLRVFRLFRDTYSKLSYTNPTINITFSYATKGGSPTDNIQRKANFLRDKVGRLIRGCNFHFAFIGASELLDLTRKLPQTIFRLKIAESPISSDDSESFVTLIRLDEYHRFITDESGSLRSRLFEANVRDWQGDNKVNSQIQKSLESKQVEDFWWLNNGVTILATTANLTGSKTLQLENPEIVNGLQTSRAIFSYFSDPTRKSEDERKILVRIIVVSDEKESREQIIKATNSQTPVPDEALRSLDRIHRNIESFFLAQEPPLYYDRRRNYYKNQGKSANRIIGIKRLAQSVIATALFKPDDARGRPGDYLRASDDELYLSVFNQDYPPSLYYFCAQYYQLVDDILRHDQIEERFQPNQRRAARFHIMTHIILCHTKVDRHSTPIDFIARQSIDNIDQNLMINSVNIVLDLYASMRNRQENFRWKNFEDQFFDKLDEVI